MPDSVPYRPRILLVDDERQIREFLVDLLGDDYDVAAVEDGQSALDALDEGDYQIVISDLRMPGMAGLELIERLRDRRLDVIVMTGNADIDSAVTAMRHGAYDFVRKPFTIDEILHAIQRLTQKQALEHQAERYREHLEEQVEQRTRQYRDAILAALDSLVRTLEYRDRYTRHHSENVARYSAALAMALDRGELAARIATAGMLHDIGKIGVRDAILSKAGPLTDEEMAEVRRHALIGADILDGVVEDRDILDAVRHHHEAWDGSGYPAGLAGEAIPLFARILALGDAYDAMTSDRPYRAGLPDAIARERIAAGAGTQFDPELARLFLALDLPQALTD